MRKGEKRKQDLLQIAYRMFITHGYENTSVDDIIKEAGIAKGTYYYYFGSKEQTLEEVIGMMIDKQVETAEQILCSDMPVPQKIVAIIGAANPASEEKTIEGALMQPENILMHDKVKRTLVERIVPVIAKAVEQGIKEGIFSCDNVAARVKMIVILGNELADEGDITEQDIDVYIDLCEKLLGARSGTMAFLKGIVGYGI